MNKGAEKLRWSVSRRLAYLEQRLFWDGRANRSDLMLEFGISEPQASADLSQYQKLAPGNMDYDRRAKAYFPAANFTPAFSDPSADDYLNHVRVRSQVVESAGNTLAIVPELKRKIDVNVLRQLVRAIRQGDRIRVEYQSTSAEDLAWRWIAPHGLGFDGARWHARAFCGRHSDFRDFVLSRMFDVDGSEPSNVPVHCDVAWKTPVTVRLRANPKLSAGMKLAVSREYGMADGTVEVSMPLCLAFYMEATFAVAQPDAEPNPAKFQVVIANSREIRRMRSEAERATNLALKAFRKGS